MIKRMMVCFLLVYMFPVLMVHLLPGIPKPQKENLNTYQEPTEPLPENPEIPTEPASPMLRVKMENTIEVLPLEDYVEGVILAEMPADFEMEALKAQAVVARTYAMRMFYKPKHTDAEVCGNPKCCQGYLTISEYRYHSGTEESIQKVKNAVKATAGEVLLYQGKLIEATYFSCSGGRTEDAVAVWGNDVPYLQSVESPGEEKSNFYTDTAIWEVSDFKKKLGLSGGSIVVENISYTKGGGVQSLTMCGKKFLGTELRELLNLRSTAFSVTVVGNSVIVTTKGYGHRVGMSQYGADAMAAGGSSYRQILLHYYQGVTVTAV